MIKVRIQNVSFFGDDLARPQNELNSTKSIFSFFRLGDVFFSFDLFLVIGLISLSLFLRNYFALSINSYALVAERFREKSKSLVHGSKNVAAINKTLLKG